MFEALFEHHQSVRLIVDPKNGSILRANQSALEYYGYRHDEITRLKISDINTLSLQEVEQEMRAAEENRRNFFNFKHRLADGQIRDVEVHSTLVPHANRDLLFSVVQDVTEKKLMESKLRESNALLESVVSASGIGVWKWDIATGETEFDQRWFEIIGFTREELEPISIETWLNNTHPDDLIISKRNLDEYFSGKVDRYECDCRIRHKAGHWVWVHDKGIVTEWDVNNKPVVMVGSHTDISERKNRLSTLEKQRNDLEASAFLIQEKNKQLEQLSLRVFAEKKFADKLINALPIPIWVSDEQFRILTCNPAFESFTNRSKAVLLGKTCFDLWQQQEATRCYEKNLEVLDQRARVVFEIDFHRDNGEVLSGVITKDLITLDQPGRQGIITAVVDVTALTQARFELEKLNHTKDLFLSVLAHDLKNPFNVMMGMSDVVQSILNEHDVADASKFFKEIRHAIYSTYELLDDLLSWSRAQTGKLDYRPEPLAFEEIIDRIRERLSLQLDLKKLVLISNSSIEEKIMADVFMLEAILRNLISNAVKFSENNSKIGVSCEEEEEFLLFAVKDEGVGMTKEEVETLFKDRFVQSHSGTHGEFGTGIGLNLCKNFVEKHGGEIWVESELGVGSQFKFRIPKK